MSLRYLARIALLAAVCVVLRYAFAGLPNIKPITALYFLLVDFEDLKGSLLVMSISIFVSSFLFGMGPWVLFQILSFTVVICLWYLLYRRLGLFGQSMLALILAFSYGLVIDGITALLYQMPWWTYVAEAHSHAVVQLCGSGSGLQSSPRLVHDALLSYFVFYFKETLS